MFFIILGGLILVVSIPMLFGLIPPNKWYGIRVPAAFESRENWYRINRFGAAVFAILGVILSVTGTLMMLSNWEPTVAQGILLLVSPLFVVQILGVVIAIYCRRFSR